MKKILLQGFHAIALSLLTLFFFANTTLAQPCLPTPGGIPATDGPPGCRLCLPTYSGSNAGSGPQGPNPSCWSVQNNVFISVTADASGSISATVVPSNCTNGGGLHMMIMDDNLNFVSNCLVGGGGLPQTVSASGLTPGATYFVMIDGWAGDVCDFFMTVSGTTAGGPLPPPGPITADPDTNFLCPGAVVCYKIDTVPGALEYEWNIPGNGTIVSGGGTNDLEMCVKYDSPGGGVVSVAPSNFCFPGIPSILPVAVVPILPTLKQPEFVCVDDFPILRDGWLFTEIGSASVTYTTALGCDSVVNYTFLPLVQIPNVIDTTLCIGDSIIIGNMVFKTGGAYRITLEPPFQQANGCDSLVILGLNILEPIANIAPPGQLDCDTTSTINLDGSASSSGSNVTFAWSTPNGCLLPPLNSNIATVDAPGDYILCVTLMSTDSTGSCKACDTVNVTRMALPLAPPVFNLAPADVCEFSNHTYSVSPVPDAFNYVWTAPAGATINGSGTTVNIDFGAAGTGMVCVTAQGDCGDSPETCINVNIFQNPTADFTASSPICITDAATILYTGNATAGANYSWNFNGGTPATVSGPGPHMITWGTFGIKTITLIVEENGCISPQGTQVVLVDAELQPPVISCVSTTDEVTFSWLPVPGATDYTVTINSGTPTTQAGTSITQSGLSPGESVTITVQVNGTTACDSSMASSSCLAQNCSPVALNIMSVPDICRDASTSIINLSFNPTGGVGGGTHTWNGPGISGDTFDPQAANPGPNVISLEYVEGTCTYTGAITINVNDIPDASFNLSSPICITENATVTYTGSASAGANYTWNFNGGTIISGSGAGPYEINWSSANTYNVSLTVEENNCTSLLNSQPIQVDDTLAAPIIRCISSTTTAIVFGWNDVPGATDYVVNGPGIVDMGTRTVTVTGLNTGDMITIEVVANGNTVCGSSRAQGTCITSNCPATPIDVTQIGPFCKDGSASLVSLDATAGDNSGTFTWNGPGVSQPNMFDPNAPSVNPGTLNLRVTYQKDNCTYDTTMQVVINEQPTADFDIESPICRTETSSIFYNGNASSGAVYDWNFGTGIIQSGTGITSDPFEIEWATAGNQDITLTVEENNCFSSLNTQTVQVDAPMTPPLISCDANQNSINFNWLPVTGALTYDVALISGTAGTFDGTFNYDVAGLNPGDLVTIEVTVNGTTVCGPVSSTFTCEAKNCPDYSLVMPNVTPICLDGTQPSFSLDSLLSIVNMLGEDLKDSVRLRWHDGSDMNDYISLGGQFFPTAAGNNFGTGDVPIALEVEYPPNSGCFQTFNTTIELNPLPRNSITIDKDPLCISDQAIVGLTNPLTDPAGTIVWDFGSANVLTGTGAGPYDLSWDLAGVDTLRVTVTEKGCTVGEIIRPVRIDEELNGFAANLRCNLDNTGNTMIEFEWDQVPGVDDYDFSIISTNISPIPVPTNMTGTTVFYDGLMPNDSITLELTLTDTLSACPPVTISATCKAKECPQTVVEIEAPADSCLLISGQTTIQLNSRIQNDPTGGTGVSTWSGDDVNSIGTFTPQGQGIYNISHSYTSDGCTFTGNLTFRMFETPVADFTVDPVICETEVAMITFNGSAPPSVDLEWTIDNGGVFSGTDRDPQTVDWTDVTGIQNITLDINNNGCRAATVSQTVQVDPALDPVVVTCNGPNGSITDIDFIWNNDPNVSDYEIFVETPFGSGTFVSAGTQVANSFLMTGLASGTGEGRIRVVARGNTICPEQTFERNCKVLPCPTITVEFPPLNPVCVNADPFPILANANGGDGSTFPIITGPGFTSLGLFTPADAGIGTHTLTANYDQNGCTYTGTTQITVNGLPDVEAGETLVLSCDAESVQIGNVDTPDNLDYEWTLNGDIVGTDRMIDVSEGGTYTLTVTDPMTGCSNSDDIFVDASFSDPVIAAEISEITCFGRNDGTITVTDMPGGVAPFEFSVNGDDFSTESLPFVISNLGSGTYVITGRDINGCESDISFTIVEPDELTIEIVITAGENPVEFPDSIQLEAVTNYAPDLLSSVDWSPSDQFPICDETNITNCLTAWVSPTGQTVYSVRIENLNGCASEDELKIDVLKTYPAYIPSAFSPSNRDGINDELQIFGSPELIQSVKAFLVFDRWGNLMFEKRDFDASAVSDPANGWDGTYNGKLMNSGVYVYFAEIEFIDGLVEIFKGDVTLK